MRFIFISLFLFLITIETQASDPYSYLCHDSSACPEYVYRPCGKTGCLAADCSSTEIPLAQYCISVDCSRSLLPSEQNGWDCVPIPRCELKEDEYRASDQSCVYCPPPGVFDNDTCNVCTEDRIYSIEHGTCIERTCSEGYVKPHPTSNMCYPQCQSGYEMDVFGNCNKLPETTCPDGYNKVGNNCVPIEPEPQPNQCETVVSSINCLTDSVFNAVTSATNNLGSLFQDIIDLLTGTSETLDTKLEEQNQNPNLPNQPDQNVDTSSMYASMSFKEIAKSQLEEDRFQSHPQCPSDRTLEKWGTSYTFSFSQVCTIADKLSSLIMILAYLTAAFILVRK